MDEQTRRQARSFDGVADRYERGRPGFPREAAVWLTGSEPAVVLELGAGTGKLTRELDAIGHDVYATDPSEAMLAQLRHALPDVRTAVAPAEEIPLPDNSVEVVVAAQAFHWFDLPVALPEIARVLTPGGRLALVWNHRDDKIPWVRRLGDLIGTQEQLTDPTGELLTSGLFGYVEHETFRISQHIDRHSIQDLVASRSNVAILDDAARERKLAQLLAFYDDYGRGMDGMRLPYITSCFRSTVAPPPVTTGPEPSSGGDDQRDEGDDADGFIFDLR